jgi:hypothetical protein
LVHSVEETGDVEIDHDAAAVLDVRPRSLVPGARGTSAGKLSYAV